MRWATTSRTRQPSHSVGASHSAGVSSFACAANPVRSATTRSHVSMAACLAVEVAFSLHRRPTANYRPTNSPPHSDDDEKASAGHGHRASQCSAQKLGGNLEVANVPEGHGRVPCHVARRVDAPVVDDVGHRGYVLVDNDYVWRLKRLPYGLHRCVEERVDLLVVVAVAAVVWRRTQIGARCYHSQGQIVVDVGVHPCQRKLNRLDPGGTTSGEERLPGHRLCGWWP